MAWLRLIVLSALSLGASGFLSSPISSYRGNARGVGVLKANARPNFSLRTRMASSTVEENVVTSQLKRTEGISSTKPALGVWEFITNWHWGVQDSKIPLPIEVVEGQAPEFCSAITQEHLDTLARDGVVLVKGVLNKSWIDYLRRIIDWQVAHPHVLALTGVISNLYDYVQRCAWRTNPGFANFLYYSPVASALGQLAACGWFPEGDRRGRHEIRISTDLLLVNPNKGFQWHQDEQNGPLTAGRGSTQLDALRYWITVDDTRADFGAPVYLKGSQENEFVDRDVVFVDMEANGVLARYEATRFQPEAGDMIVWHPKVIHKVDGAPKGWGDEVRRVLAGTAAVDDCVCAFTVESG